ncbi:ORMDL family [Chytridium lagenaria]|nr:ORMDL family [Chytridium lagenaria]
MFHWVIGTPFDQLDNGAQFTPTKKYLTLMPIVLFLLSTHYTHYDFPTFMINLTSLIIVLIGKMPQMHNVRIFGINRKSYPE